MRDVRFLWPVAFLLAWFPANAEAQNPYTRTDYDAQRDPLHVITTDIDGDGDPDIAASSQATGTTPGSVTLLLNDGTGSFSEADASPLSADDAHGLAAADFDGNGAMDLAVANPGPETITLLLNDGTVSFTSELLGDEGLFLRGVHDVAAADFDGDGDPDLVAATRVDGMKALANQEGGWDVTDISNPGGFEHQDVTTGDFDGDGRPDVAVAITGDDEVGILLNESPADADPDTVEFSMSTAPVQNVPRDVAAGDWDQDDDLDLVASNSQDPDPVSVLTNDGAGTFTETDTLSAGASPWGIAGGELDEEAGLDFAVANRNGGDVSFFLNDGTGTFGRFGTDQEVGALPQGLATGLLNGDDVADVIVANPTDDDVSVLTSTDPLPVELAAFRARAAGEAVRLTWRTASETNNSGFEVQRRARGSGGTTGSRSKTGSRSTEGSPGTSRSRGTWKKIGFVDSKASGGTTTEPKSYRFEDTGVPYAADTLEYRLRQVDFGGTEALTDPIAVSRTASELELRKAFPNPAREGVTIRFAVPDRGEVSLRLYDMLGRQVRTLTEGAVEGRQEMQVDLSGLSSGTYFLRLNAQGRAETQQMTVLR